MAKKSNIWETLKNGIKRNGNWYASQYPTGWYFVYGTSSCDGENIGTIPGPK